MAGRYPGVKVSFREICEYIFTNHDYWVVEGDKGAWAAWNNGRFIGVARSEQGARNLCVREFERVLRGEY